MDMSFFVMSFYGEAMHMRSMGMSFFVVCPLRNCECKAPKIGMNCNQSLIILSPFDSSRFSGQLSRIYKACPGATLRITFLVLNEYGICSVILSPCKPGLGQGHTKKRHLHVPYKKRHLHAQQKVSFTYNPEAPFGLELMAEREHRGHLLK
jgi:hypothetical protein